MKTPPDFVCDVQPCRKDHAKPHLNPKWIKLKHTNDEVKISEDAGWTLIWLSDSGSEAWENFKVLLNEHAPKNVWRLGFNRSEDRIARNTDAKLLAEYYPDQYRRVIEEMSSFLMAKLP